MHAQAHAGTGQSWCAWLWHQRRLWLLVPLFVAFPLFFVGGPEWVAPRLYRELWSQGHMVFFAVLSLWLTSVVSMHSPRRWLVLSLLVLIAGVIIEGIQSKIGRTASWEDVLRNLIGLWLGLFWSLPADRRVWLGRGLASALLLWQLAGLASHAAMHFHRIQQFPVLSDFEGARDLDAWSGQVERVNEPVREGRFSLAVHLGTQRFSGVRSYTLRRDWRGYRELVFELYNPLDDELTINLRINDRQHEQAGRRFADRFNRQLNVSPGWNQFRISLEDVRQAPEGRAMNMAEIQQVQLFVHALEQPRTVYLDYIRLE
jgi:VanZ family protein